MMASSGDMGEMEEPAPEAVPAEGGTEAEPAAEPAASGTEPSEETAATA